MEATKEILFIGSFKLPENGTYGGVYTACTSLKEKLLRENIKIIELDTTLKDIKQTSIIRRLPSLMLRVISMLFSIATHRKAKHLFVFISGGNSYLDKLFPIWLASLLGKRVVLFPRSGLIINSCNSPFYRFIISKAFHAADDIVCQSDFWYDFFSSRFDVEKKLTVIENWVPEQKLLDSKQNIFLEYNEKDAFRIVFVSRIEIDKGIQDIIELARRLLIQFNIKIEVYGAGSFENEFLEEIRKSHLNDVIEFKGWLEKDKMFTILNNFHLAIFTSRLEGYPNAILDYALSKVPILATEIPSIRAVGKDNMTYYQPGNIDDFYTKVVYCIQHHDLVLEKSKKLYDEKMVNNSIDYSYKKMKEVLT